MANLAESEFDPEDILRLRVRGVCEIAAEYEKSASGWYDGEKDKPPLHADLPEVMARVAKEVLTRYLAGEKLPHFPDMGAQFSFAVGRLRDIQHHLIKEGLKQGTIIPNLREVERFEPAIKAIEAILIETRAINSRKLEVA